MSEFKDHVIVETVEAPGFRSWRMHRLYEDTGNPRSEFWVRITAADRQLVVTGDFDPTVFAYGDAPRGEERDPTNLVYWIAGGDKADHYRIEKAATGMGSRERISAWDGEQARAHLKQVRDEELEDDAESWLAKAIDEALEDAPGSADFSGGYWNRYDCDDLLRRVIDSVHCECSTTACETIGNAGQSAARSVDLAVRACNRLVELLEAAKGKGQ